MTNDLPPLPEGFKRISGKDKPMDPNSRWFVQLRCGFVDRRIAYAPSQLKWIHGFHSGDIVAVQRGE